VLGQHQHPINDCVRCPNFGVGLVFTPMSFYGVQKHLPNTLWCFLMVSETLIIQSYVKFSITVIF